MYHRSISERNPTTMADLRDLCRKVEQGIDSIKAFQTRQKAKYPSKTPKSHNSDAKPEQTKKKNPNQKKKYSNDKAKCFRCDRNNHTLDDCRAKTKLDSSIIEGSKSPSKSVPQKVKQITEDTDDDGIEQVC